MNFGFRLLRRFTGGNFSNVCNRCASTSSSVVFGAKKEFASKRADLPHEDEKLTGRGDFVGVKRKQAPEVKGVVPEAQIAKLQELACQNHRISAHSFFIYILHPLEQAQTVFCDIVRRSPQLYVSMFIKMCGEVMSDVPIQNRMIILNRLMKALYANGIKATIDDMKAMLQVLLENYFDFNVKDMINVVENKFTFSPDATFFGYCAWQLAKNGDLEAFEWLTKEMSRRNIVPPPDVALAKIFCLEKLGDTNGSRQAIDVFLLAYPSDSARSLSASAAIRGALCRPDINRFRLLIEEALDAANTSDTNTRSVLCLDQKDVFEIIWLMAYNNGPQKNHQFEKFTEKMLDTVNRKEGFFKLLFANAERHIAHQLYYTAIALVADSLRISGFLEQQSRNTFIRHILAKLCNQMICSQLPIDQIADITDRVVSRFGKNVRFHDELLFSILTYRYHSYDRRMELFIRFIGDLDEKRERVHLVLPLMSQSRALSARCNALATCTRLGYRRFSELDALVVDRLLFWPMQREIRENCIDAMDDQEVFDAMARRLHDCGVSAPESWMMMSEMLRERNNSMQGKLIFNGLTKIDKLHVWLNNNVDMLKVGNCQLQNTALLSDGKPSLSYTAEDATASVGCLNSRPVDSQQICDVVSGVNYNSRRVDNFSDVARLLGMLTEAFEQDPNHDVHRLIDIAFELRQKYPNAKGRRTFSYEVLRAYTRMFRDVLYSEALTPERIDSIVKLLLTTIRLEFIHLHITETLTSDIVRKAYFDLGWPAAIETWMHFQSCLNCSNALLELLRFSTRRLKNDNRADYLKFKAANFMPMSLINAFHITIHINQRHIDDAVALFKESNPKISLADCTMAFRLMISHKFLSKSRPMWLFVRDFLWTALQHADRGDSADVFHRDANFLFERALAICIRNEYPLLAVDLYNWFQEKSIRVNPRDMFTLIPMLQTLQRRANLWIFSPSSGMLNTTNVRKELAAPATKYQSLSDYEKTLKRITYAMGATRRKPANHQQKHPLHELDL